MNRGESQLSVARRASRGRVPSQATGVETIEPTPIGGSMNNHRMTRRSFLGTTAARRRFVRLKDVRSLGLRGRPGQLAQAAAGAESTRSMPAGPATCTWRIRPRNWPSSSSTSPDLEKKLGDVKFIGGDMIPPANVDQLAEKVREADARAADSPLRAWRRRAGAGQAH